MARYGRYNRKVFFLLILLVVFCLYLLFFNDDYRVLSERDTEKIGLILIIGGIFFYRRIVRSLYRKNLSSKSYEVRLSEREGEGFGLALLNGSEPIYRLDYPFQYKYFRSKIDPVGVSPTYVLHLLLSNREGGHYQLSNFINPPAEEPEGWDTLNMGLPPNRYFELPNLVDLVTVLNELSTRYAHLAQNLPTETKSFFEAFEAKTAQIEFRYDHVRNTETLMRSRIGRSIAGMIAAITPVDAGAVRADMRLLEDLVLTEEDLVKIAVKIEMYYGFNIPEHILSEAKTVGYLIQYVQFKKEKT